MSINQQLEKLYTTYLDHFLHARLLEGDECSSFPLLLKIDEDSWLRSGLKIMIFGQETRGWGSKHETIDVQSLMTKYDQFYYKKKTNPARNKAFFNAFNRVTKYIKEAPEYQDKEIEIIWNNINKIGRYSGTKVTELTRKLEREYLNVIPQEIDILKPDLVIFFGTGRDGDILFNFPNAVIERKLTSVNGQSSKRGKYAFIKGYPFKAIRLYHPASRGYCTNEYLQLVINDWLGLNKS